MLLILLISFVVAPLAANPRFPRQFGPPSNAPSFGPNWGNNQQWGNWARPTFRPQQPPQPPTVFPEPPIDTPDSSPVANDEPPPAGQIFHNPPDGCSCPRTRQFNPVCGTDGNTYSNQALLDCFISCGTQVAFRYAGNCRRAG